MVTMNRAELAPDGSPNGLKAVAYVRRSTDRQEQSLADQQVALQRYADENGFEILRVYTDDAISGTSADNRKAFQQLITDAMHPDFRYVLCYDVKRFSRGDNDEAGYYRHLLRQQNIEVIYASENFAGDDTDDLVRPVKQYLARQESKDLSKVTIRGQVSHSETGAWCGGTPPIGFDLLYIDSAGAAYQRVRWTSNGDKEICSPEGKLIRVLPRGECLSTSKKDRARLVLSTADRIEIVRRIFEEYVELGRGFRTIADGLNRDGIPSPRDGNWSSNTLSKWSIGTIRAILRNPAYKGDTVWNRRTFAKFHRLSGGIAVPRARTEADKPRENPDCDWIVVRGTHEPIIPPAIFERAQSLMKARGQNAGPKNFRAGSGLRSPYLLSGLVACGRCGHSFQGRTIRSTKIRNDGTKIQTLYYACGGYVMKGRSACEKFLLRKDPLEGLLLEKIQGRLQSLLAGEGEKALRQLIEEEIAAQGQDPRQEIGQIRLRIDEIHRKADVLLEGLSEDTKSFVDGKLRSLGTEKQRLQRRLEELASARYEPIDAEAVIRHGMASLRDLPRLLESGSLEERKEFVRAFVAGVMVYPDEERLEVQMRKIPASVLPKLGFSSVGVVAGAGFEPATFGL